MNNYNIKRITKALDLEREIIGLKFITFKDEYEKVALHQIKGPLPFCAMANKAMAGQLFKAQGASLRCKNGAYALGLVKPASYVLSGKTFEVSGLYESKTVAKDVVKSMKYLNHEAYGIIVGPLAQLKDADIVLIIANVEQVMRIMQGYAYKHGAAHNLGSIGNQAMCSDLVAKPMQNNDINFSFLCKGARLHTRADIGELGIGLPIQLFDDLANGIIQTINPVLNKQQKQSLLKRLDKPDELDIEIDLDEDYSKTIEAYEDYAKKQK